ncbi:hypothetical protein HIO71_11115 [Chryseobacterium aquaticum]|uniref:Phage abortive infection protein n=1 Tax=Chryseobacterium aquaticum TaxID=452084 RepID=A0A848N309_9FLAO|nr:MULTISPECIES: putative phage abortive infection protein [Chryseobacterium]NMR34756.1 hypothetical protein [Chryseobacterium aquaticum]NRQ46856.1 hypothetical protein [Chryseobacterium sp. C-204]
MKNNISIYWLIGLMSLIFMCLMLWVNYQYATSLGDKYQGIFGDMFGAANALFTGLSFTGLIITILLQRQELKETRDEFIKQNETLINQKFENTFFNLINNHHQIVSDMRSKEYTMKQGQKFYTYFEGRAVFEHMFSILLNNLDDDISTYDIKYLDFYRKFGYKFIHYVKNLYQIIKLVDENDFNVVDHEKQKLKYISIIWSQLSDHEIALLFYHTSYDNGQKNFKTLIEKHSLFKDINELFILNEIKNLYSNDAFR